MTGSHTARVYLHNMLRVWAIWDSRLLASMYLKSGRAQPCGRFTYVSPAVPRLRPQLTFAATYLRMPVPRMHLIGSATWFLARQRELTSRLRALTSSFI